MKKPHLQLNPTDREQLEQLVAKGELAVRVLKRALALLALDRGESMSSVAKHQQVTNNTVTAWRNRYLEAGVAGIYDDARSGRPVKIDGVQRAKITALACSEPPAGHGQWTLRLLADKIVELDYCESISHTQVAQILKKTQ
jgi:putative transposase